MYQRIDTRWGSRNTHRLGRGNTLPYTGVPFGMNHFVLETRPEDVRFFHPDDGSVYGIRLTHQPSPWMGDFAYVTWQVAQLTPQEYQRLQTGLDAAASQELAYSGYRSDRAQFRPGYLAYQRLRDGLHVACCPTEAGASLRLEADPRYPTGQWVMSLVLAASGWVRLEGHRLTLYTDQLAGSKYGQFGQYQRLDWPDTVRLRLVDQLDIGRGLQQVWVALEMAEPLQVMEVDWVTSYIDEAQLDVTQAHADFFALDWTSKCAHTQAQWEDYLGRIEVQHRDPRWCDRFYHCLYRTATFPQVAHEYDARGARIHRSPYTGRVEPGAFYTNNGYWDTFRSNYPLYALVIPERIPLFLEGIRSVAREDGFLPKWLSPDERGLMPGTLVDAVIADAIVKDLIPRDLAEDLYAAMLATAQTASDHPLEGREGGADYERLGYLPASYHESVNKSLDYAYSDFCISQVATALGDSATAARYRARSQRYRQLWDDATGLMRPRDAQGQWATTDWQPEAWGGAYTEGSAWQNSFGALHDLADAVARRGGDVAFYQQFQHLVNQVPRYQVGGYGYEIHEMLEMARWDFGQLALSNQPSFHLPYLPIYAGFPHLAHQLLKTLMTEAFCLEDQGYIGDEDNGSLSAWFVLSSLGCYAVTPGTRQYVLGINGWESACLHLPGGRTFQWRTVNPAAHLSLVQTRWLNGAVYAPTFIDYGALMAGGVLEQELGWLPDVTPLDETLRPFSLALDREE